MAITAISDEVDGTIRLRCIKGAVTEPHYTLTELKQLVKQYVDSTTSSTALEKRLEYSRFLAWLAKREQGKEAE